VTITSVEEGGGGRGHPDLDSPQQQGKGEGGGKAKDRVETRGGAGPGPGPGPGPVPQGNCITIGFLIATPTQAAATAVEQTLADPTFAAKVGESSVLSALPCFTCSSTSCPALHCSPPPLPAPLLLLFLLHHLCFPHHGTTFQTPPAPPPPPPMLPTQLFRSLRASSGKVVAGSRRQVRQLQQGRRCLPSKTTRRDSAAFRM
jgi:hypothetical protein